MASRTRNDHFQDITVSGSLSMGADSAVEGNLIPDTSDSRTLGNTGTTWGHIALSGVGAGLFGTGGLQGKALISVETHNDEVWGILFENEQAAANVVGGLYMTADGSFWLNASGATPNTTATGVILAADGDVDIIAAPGRSTSIRNDGDALQGMTISAGVVAPLTAAQSLGSASLPWRVYHDVVATASLPAAGASMNGVVLIEDNGTGDRNLIIYAGGQRFRIDGGAAF